MLKWHVRGSSNDRFNSTQCNSIQFISVQVDCKVGERVSSSSPLHMLGSNRYESVLHDSLSLFFPLRGSVPDQIVKFNCGFFVGVYAARKCVCVCSHSPFHFIRHHCSAFSHSFAFYVLRGNSFVCFSHLQWSSHFFALCPGLKFYTLVSFHECSLTYPFTLPFSTINKKGLKAHSTTLILVCFFVLTSFWLF